MNSKIKVGTKIRIIELFESDEYKNAEGVVTKHPYPGVYYGTWGDKPVFSNVDKIEVVEECGK